MFLLPYCWHFKSSRKQIHDTKFWFQSTSKNITFYTVQTSTTVWIDEYSQLQCMVWTKFWLLYHLNHCEGETEEVAEEALMADGAEVLEGTDGTTLDWYVFFFIRYNIDTIFGFFPRYDTILIQYFGLRNVLFLKDILLDNLFLGNSFEDPFF